MVVYVTMTCLSLHSREWDSICSVFYGHFTQDIFKLPLLFLQFEAILIINLKIICAWSRSTIGQQYNLLALTLQGTVNGQTHGTTFNYTFPPSLFRALCSCQRRKSKAFDNEQLAEHAAGQLARRRRKWPWVNGNNRKSLQQQLGSLLRPPPPSMSLLPYIADYSCQCNCKTQPIAIISQRVNKKY